MLETYLRVFYFRDKKAQEKLLTDFRARLSELEEQGRGRTKCNLYQLAWWEVSQIPGDGTCDCDLCSAGLFCP